MTPGPVAVIDIGSNSIKILVATRDADGQVLALGTKTVDARISAGISQTEPRLTRDSMNRGVAALRELFAFAAPFHPVKTIMVATSAVRDALNGDEFRALVRSELGHEIRILSGKEEANLIGQGLTCDPALSSLQNFYVFDLGGGSLECLAFQNRTIVDAASLQLGCVRLTEAFVTDARLPLTHAAASAITTHVRAMLSQQFRFSLPAAAVAVGTDGTITTIRAMAAARAGKSLEAISSTVTLAEIQQLERELSALSLIDRQRVEGLPAARADVFPTALVTLIAIAEAGGFSGYRHSFYNLRFGLAADTLGGG